MLFFKKIFFILPKNLHLQLSLIFFGILIGVLFELISLGLIFPVLTILIVPEKLATINFFQPLYYFIVNKNLSDLIKYISIFFLIVILVKVTILLIVNYYKSKIYLKFSNILSENLFKIYLL